VFFTATGDYGLDPDRPDPFAVFVVVVATVGVDRLRALTGTSAAATYRWDGLDQRDELGDVVAATAGRRPTGCRALR
jgi:hypothetical protein